MTHILKKTPCNGRSLTDSILNNLYQAISWQGNGHGVFGLQWDYIDILLVLQLQENMPMSVNN